MIKINIINFENIYLLENFILLNKSKYFRYYCNRNINVINNHLLTIILTKNNKIIGYGHLDKAIKIWLGICVLEEYKSQGYGKMILNYLIDYSKNNKIEKIYLTVDKENIIAKNLYEKYNFMIDETTQKIYKMVKVFK
jgi:ribosomal protein S18 acetylase RimI-like enzyme